MPGAKPKARRGKVLFINADREFSEGSFNHSVFAKNYERVLSADVAKLFFAETYEGISGAGQRVFSFNVQGKDFKDFDIFAKAGGANKTYVETVRLLLEVAPEVFRGSHFAMKGAAIPPSWTQCL